MKNQKIEFTIPSNCKATAEVVGDKVVILCEPIETEPIENEPKKKEWELEENREYFYLSPASNVNTFVVTEPHHLADKENRNLFRYESDAESMLAYIQLLEMYYQEIGDYKCNHKDLETTYSLHKKNDEEISVEEMCGFQHVFEFPTYDAAEKFLIEYSDLIEQAKRFI